MTARRRTADPMSVARRILALRGVPCFAGLDDHELMAMARVARVRSFAPGEILCPAGAVLRNLYVVVRGTFESPDGPVGDALLGPPSLLFGATVAEELRASPGEGATCLVFRKGHFFTILHQCPSVLCRMIGMRGAEGARP